MILAAVVMLAGCGEVQELSGAVVRVQACEDAIKLASETTGTAQRLGGDPGKLGEALDTAADDLDDAAARAGDATLKDAVEGLADYYRDLEVDGEAARKVASNTAKYLQVITAACAAQ